MVRNKKGFTLVELLSVIVILAIILVIAVPQIMKTIDESREGALVSSAKLIAASAEREYLVRKTLGDTNFDPVNVEMDCADVAETTTDYTECEISFDENGKAIVTLKGEGKFKGKYVCAGTRENATVTEESCTLVALTVDANGGTNTVEYNAKYEASSTVELVVPTAPEGKEFDCWEVTGDGASVNGNTLIMGTEATTIKAIWKDIIVASVGDTMYGTIDEAIDNWVDGSTLTLLRDVTLTDVVQLNSNEHHILELGEYTMTAAEGMNAIEIIARGTVGLSASYESDAITINADSSKPGGINAGKKSIIYYKYSNGEISVEDRPVININGGVFTGSTSSFGTAGIYIIGTEARKTATLNISNGTFNCSILGSGKSKLLISGGTFNYSVGSQGDTTAIRLIWGGRFKTLGFMSADSNNSRFWIGTSMGNSDVGVYIDDDNYLVIGGPVITEPGSKFEASATNATKWSTYLQYSSAAEYGLYYMNAEMAIDKHGEANVTIYTNTP